MKKVYGKCDCGGTILLNEDTGYCRCDNCGCDWITPAESLEIFLRNQKPVDEDTLKCMSDEPENVIHHRRICNYMNDLYARKNKDYGDSFHLSFEEEGMAMARIRLGDKLNRFKTLTKAGDQLVQDESIRDTLIDLANYAIMTVMEIDRMGEGK